ncbi:biotin synthase BioB [Desulfovibrio sp. OttesenSCG-928-I05]|nr:biotin synthase BioB [Desulfovibrio sp. OttesenSCG-928-I05]
MPDPVKTIRRALREGREVSAREALALTPLLPASLRDIVEAALAANVAAPSAAAPAPFACGILNAKSGRCGEDCAFCAQSRYHECGTPVYPLVPEEAMLERARILSEHGVRRMGIVTSGAAPSEREIDRICAAARRIRDTFPIALCASLGMLDAAKARRLREAGFTRYHHNLETARSFYPAICSSHAYEGRIATLHAAREAGLELCSGGLFGMGESWEQRIELAVTLRELDVDSIPVNFLMPVAGTRLGETRPLEAQEGLGIVALFRILHPGRDIVLCGGRGRTLGEWDRTAFPFGANGIMVGDYLTAKGNAFARDMELLDVLGVRHA